MAERKKQFMFVIRKIHSAYLVTGNEDEVQMEPLYYSRREAACATISTTMQMVGQSKLMLHHPDDPCQYLKEYYRGLGWDIENAD